MGQLDYTAEEVNELLGKFLNHLKNIHLNIL